MKKIKYLLMLLVVAIISTGCVKFNANMDIKKDKSMDFSIIYAFDKTIFGSEQALKESDMEEAKKQGFTVTKYSEGNMEGFTLSKKINNIDEVSTENEAEYDLSGLMEENNENKYLFKVVKGKDKNTYYAKFKFDANDSGLNMDDEESPLDEDVTLPDEDENALLGGENTLDSDMDLNGMMANLDLSFNVTLPYSAISNNATTATNENKNLSWKLTTQGQEYIEFAFDLYNNEKGTNTTMLYIGIGVLLLVGIIAIIVVVSISKKNKGEKISDDISLNTKEAVNNSEEQVEPTLKKNE